VLDPPARVGGKFYPSPVIELPGCSHEADISLLDEIKQAQSPVDVASGQTHNEAQVGLDQFRDGPRYTGFGGGWRWRGFGDGFATTTVEKTPVGTLVLDIFDSTSKKLIWRGTASEVLSDKAEKNEKKVEKALTEMFKHFPPPPKS